LNAGKKMATYPQIQEWVISKYGWEPRKCWIAHVKELCGLEVKPAPNRKGAERANPCPSQKRPAIEEALRQLGMVK